MRLFHVSEEAGIARFVPRPSRASHASVSGDVVWAVANARLCNYLMPRDCPRVSFFANPATSPADIATFLDGDPVRQVVAIEAAWFDRMVTTRLTCYEFAPDNFCLLDRNAGYYVSPCTETPVATETIERPLDALFARSVEVRFVPALWELRERVLASTLGFSFIRMRNAAPPAQGYEAYHPL